MKKTFAEKIGAKTVSLNFGVIEKYEDKFKLNIIPGITVGFRALNNPKIDSKNISPFYIDSDDIIKLDKDKLKEKIPANVYEQPNLVLVVRINSATSGKYINGAECTNTGHYSFYSKGLASIPIFYLVPFEMDDDILKKIFENIDYIPYSTLNGNFSSTTSKGRKNSFILYPRTIDTVIKEMALKELPIQG